MAQGSYNPKKKKIQSYSWTRGTAGTIASSPDNASRTSNMNLELQTEQILEERIGKFWKKIMAKRRKYGENFMEIMEN